MLRRDQRRKGKEKKKTNGGKREKKKIGTKEAKNSRMFARIVKKKKKKEKDNAKRSFLIRGECIAVELSARNSKLFLYASSYRETFDTSFFFFLRFFFFDFFLSGAEIRARVILKSNYTDKSCLSVCGRMGGGG